MKRYNVAYLYNSKFNTIESEILEIEAKNKTEALKLAKEHYTVPENVIDFKVL